MRYLSLIAFDRGMSSMVSREIVGDEDLLRIKMPQLFFFTQDIVVNCLNRSTNRVRAGGSPPLL